MKKQPRPKTYEEIKIAFEQDCKKLGIKPFNFESKDGPWRELYIHQTSKGTRGKKNSKEKICRIGVRLESDMRNGKKFKVACNDLIKQIEEMREKTKSIEAAYDHKFKPNSLRRILEDYRKIYEEAAKTMRETYNSSESKARKVEKNYAD